jgi:selenide,water dikinase
MAVTGLVHPRKILRNVGARPGDKLLLTKPLGSGVLSTAIKRGVASPEETQRAIELMAQLNRAAGEAFAATDAVHALTDVTGFGLLGHGLEMAKGSGVALRLVATAVPLVEGVLELAEADVVPGGTKANLAWVGESTRFADDVPPALRLLLADAQTNGGLLAAVSAERATGLRVTLASAGVGAVEIGEVVEGGEGPAIEVALR